MRMSILLWIVVGGIAGSVLAYIAKEKSTVDFFSTIIIGVLLIVLSGYLLITKMTFTTESIRLIVLTLSLGGIGLLLLSVQATNYK